MRALECPKCGAPVRREPGANQAVCAYCGTHLVVDQQGPKPAGQPRHPQPPAATPPFKPVHLVIPLVFGLVLVGGAMALIFQQSRAGASAAGGANHGAAATELAALSLSVDAQSVAKQFHSTVRDSKRVSIDLRDPIIETVYLTWDDPAHITGISLTFRKDAPRERAIASLQAQLGRAFYPASTGGQQFNGEGVGLSLSTSLSINAHGRDGQGWQARLNALWTAVKFAVFGIGKALDTNSRRSFLNIGNSLQEASRLKVDTLIDARDVAVHQLFPGASTHRVGFWIGLDHPWFSHITLDWANEKKGHLSQASLYYWTDPKGGPSMQAVENCLTPLLKSATRQETDHAQGKYALDWPAQGGLPRVHVTPQLVMIFPNPGRGAATSQSGWTQLMTALAACK